MIQSSPNGLRKRCARAALVGVVGCLCLALAACGSATTRKDAESKDKTEKTERYIYAADAEKEGIKRADAKDGPPLRLQSRDKAPDKRNQESYGRVLENPFRSPQVAPLSTFSADVNTASYSNVRRYLNEGQLPPRDAVLLAEMVNYFPYRYGPPPGDAPVSLTLDLAPCPWKKDHKLVRVGVQARTLSPADLPPRNLVFLIDTSGSMNGPDRLGLVKRSLELLIDELTDRDRVSIVTYAGEAGLKLQPTRGSQKDAIRSVVRGLQAGGRTNGEGGIKLAYETARRSFIEGGANRVILCTDGDFNVGQTSESELVQLIERERNSRVFLTVLGFGMGNLKNQELEQLANHGNGHYAYLDSMEEAHKVFVQQGGALVCVAKDVKLQVEFNPRRVAAYRLIGYENRLLKDEDFKDDAKDAGDMGSGHVVTALYEVVPVGVAIDLPDVDPLKYQAPKPATESDEWLTVKMRYKDPEGGASKQLSTVLPPAAEKETMAADFQFAAAVAEFGLALRESPYRGEANFESALRRAETARKYDPFDHRAEFVALVRKAMTIRDKGRKD